VTRGHPDGRGCENRAPCFCFCYDYDFDDANASLAHSTSRSSSRKSTLALTPAQFNNAAVYLTIELSDFSYNWKPAFSGFRV